MLEAYPFNDAHLCPFPVGVDENNTAVWLNLHLAPHLLVVGATRGGKTNYLKGVLCALIQTQTPEELQLVLVDNKGTEFMAFRDVPHVVGGICDNTEHILAPVQRVADEIKRRSQLFKEAGVTTIIDYNDHVPDDKRLPRVLMIVDELQPITELPREAREKVYQYFARIGSLGAAAGIHGILCTQYAERNIIRGGIKTHFVYRVAFKMASGSDSMTAIRNHAAFKLPNIRGRAVYTYNPDPIEVQTAFVQEKHLAYAFAQARQQPAPIPFFEVSTVEEDTQEFKLPVKVRRRLTEEEFIELALTKLDGKLSPLNADKYLGDESPGKRYFDRMLENLRNRGQVEFNGKFYEVRRGDRMAYTLTPLTEQVDAIQALTA